jgi:hypothetical protein
MRTQSTWLNTFMHRYGHHLRVPQARCGVSLRKALLPVLLLRPETAVSEGHFALQHDAKGTCQIRRCVTIQVSRYMMRKAPARCRSHL